MKNKDARSLTPEKQEDLRKEAVNHVLKDGKTRGETAKLLKVSRQVVELWVKEYKKGGAVALRSGRKGRPQGWALKADQAQQIEKTIKNKTPWECGLPFSRWSRINRLKFRSLLTKSGQR